MLVYQRVIIIYYPMKIVIHIPFITHDQVIVIMIIPFVSLLYINIYTYPALWYTYPSENDGVKVRWDDAIPNIWTSSIYWLVVQCAHLEKWWTSSLDYRIIPIIPYMKWKIKHVPNHQPATYIMQGGVFPSYKWATLPLNIDISTINHIVIGVINQLS